MQRWEEILDEFALHPDAMTWHKVKGLRMSIADQFDGVQACVQKGFLQWAGVSCKEWKDAIYRITPAGLAYWEENVRGKRRRPTSADPVPKYSTAKLAAAMSPVDVFDLARAPWRWDKKLEQLQ